MRPLQGLLACSGTLLLLTLLMTFRHAEPPHGPTAAGQVPSSRGQEIRSFFNFRAPESFFPPSAIISLTHDNSTFFVARPAYYGPPLPSDGLSGQLWIGSGFGEDAVTTRVDWSAQGELGCGDIPGWPDVGSPQSHSNSKVEERPKAKSAPRAARMNPDGSMPSMSGKVKETGFRKRALHLERNDGTDNHLHWPLQGRPLHAALDSLASREATENGQANIQSMQEEAEIAGKVVLLSRGGCGFLEKTKWVQRRGGVGLIVGNNIPDPILINMYASEDTSNVTIPSVFTSYMSAHLLSSLIPAGGYFKGERADTADSTKTAIANSKPLGPNTVTSGFKSHDTVLSLLSRIKNSLGVQPDSGTPDSKRFPSSGRLNWIRADENGNEVTQGEKQKQQNHLQKPKAAALTKDDTSIDSNRHGGFEGTNLGADSSVRQSTSTSAIMTASTIDSKSFTDGGIFPGSGRYVVSGPAAKTGKQVPGPLPPLISTPNTQEGLWVTITPNTTSSSFFDTLLVLVISPLVTLTIVYALLLLRAHIQRRRWRAPKSVVERLPVRVYHTMSSSSTSISSPTAPGAATQTTPLLQAEQSSAPNRARPRSRTNSVPTESAAATLDRQRTEVAARIEKKRYQGKQVECVVCLEEYIDGESQVMSLPCGHEFHADCITPWLTTRRRTCPICKGDVVRSLGGSSEPEEPDSRAASMESGSRRSQSPPHSNRLRNRSRESHETVLDGDLERGRTMSRSPLRFTWRLWSTWWGQHRGHRDESAERDR